MRTLHCVRQSFSARGQLERLERDLQRARAQGVQVDDLEKQAKALRGQCPDTAKDCQQSDR